MRENKNDVPFQSGVSWIYKICENKDNVHLQSGVSCLL
jgi:hypothetical protein